MPKDTCRPLQLCLQVHFDANVTGPRAIIKEICDMGYTADLITQDSLSAGMDERTKETRFWRRKFWLAFVFSLPVFLLAMVFGMIPATKRGLNTHVGGFTVGELVKWALTTPVQVRVLVLQPGSKDWTGRVVRSKLQMDEEVIDAH